MPAHLTTRVTARAIAERTAADLAVMRACTTLPALDAAYRGWLAFADRQHVCRAIHDHVHDAVNEVAVEIGARETRDQT